MTSDPSALLERRLDEVAELCAAARPNAAHETIAWLEHEHAVTVLTQNVDSLHAAAVPDYADLALPQRSARSVSGWWLGDERVAA